MTQASMESGRPRQARLSARTRSRLLAWLFMVPLIVFNGAVILGPSLASLYYSFTNWDGLSDAQFLGLQNYAELFKDDDFHQAFLHNVIWIIFSLTVPLTMGLLGAFLLSRISRFQLLFRIAFFLPYTFSSVVNANIWEDLLNPDRGLARLGIPFLQGLYFFGDTRTSLLSVAFVNNWAFWGFLVVIFLAAMQGVSPDLYEAAEVDGANAWQQFLNVTIPGIRSTLMFIVLILIVWSLITFDYVYIMTSGGPSGSSELVSTLLYRDAFSNSEAGYAASMGMVIALISAGVALTFSYLRRRGWEI